MGRRQATVLDGGVVVLDGADHHHRRLWGPAWPDLHGRRIFCHRVRAGGRLRHRYVHQCAHDPGPGHAGPHDEIVDGAGLRGARVEHCDARGHQPARGFRGYRRAPTAPTADREEGAVPRGQGVFQGARQVGVLRRGVGSFLRLLPGRGQKPERGDLHGCHYTDHHRLRRCHAEHQWGETVRRFFHALGRDGLRADSRKIFAVAPPCDYARGAR
mmetsp:Transcript_93745/g.270108  ORF Transcript_93745/g.270108 Transcript_93745/m.270108 type:complete len:214 (-) Transcript_93745:521-1162(-)